MIVRLEKKNSAGQLIVKPYEGKTSFAKMAYTVKGQRRHVISMYVNGKSVILQEFLFEVQRDYMYKEIVKNLGKPELEISYLWAYGNVSDEEAFMRLKEWRFNTQYIRMAYEVAEQKSKAWHMTFDKDIITGPDLHTSAYLHGWGLQYPIKAMLAGINPQQFYKYLLK